MLSVNIECVPGVCLQAAPGMIWTHNNRRISQSCCFMYLFIYLFCYLKYPDIKDKHMWWILWSFVGHTPAKSPVQWVTTAVLVRRRGEMLLLTVIAGELGCLSAITYILSPSPPDLNNTGNRSEWSHLPPSYVFSNTLYLQHVRTAAGMQGPFKSYF